MRVHCIKEQREAKQGMEKSRPNDVPENIFKGIINKAISEWPTDYTMQVHSRDEQIEAYRELNDLLNTVHNKSIVAQAFNKLKN